MFTSHWKVKATTIILSFLNYHGIEIHLHRSQPTYKANTRPLNIIISNPCFIYIGILYVVFLQSPMLKMERVFFLFLLKSIYNFGLLVHGFSLTLLYSLFPCLHLNLQIPNLGQNAIYSLPSIGNVDLALVILLRIDSPYLKNKSVIKFGVLLGEGLSILLYH